jgi:hypothetical protein
MNSFRFAPEPCPQTAMAAPPRGGGLEHGAQQRAQRRRVCQNFWEVKEYDDMKPVFLMERKTVWAGDSNAPKLSPTSV